MKRVLWLAFLGTVVASSPLSADEPKLQTATAFCGRGLARSDNVLPLRREAMPADLVGTSFRPPDPLVAVFAELDVNDVGHDMLMAGAS